MVGLAVFAVYPFIDVLALSFSKSSLGRPFQKWPVAANYLALARDETFRAALVRTMIFAIPVPLIEMTLDSPSLFSFIQVCVARDGYAASSCCP